MLAFPVTPSFTDTFGRANANPAGAPWSLGDNGLSVVQLQISSSQFQPSGGTSSITNAYLNDGSSFADFDVWWFFTRALASTQVARCLGRIQTPGGISSGYYSAYQFNSGSPLLTVGTYTRSGGNPSFTVQASASAPSNASGHGFGLRCIGSTLYGFYFDGSVWDAAPRVSWTDPSALYASGPVGVGANTSALSALGDNFNVGPYADSLTVSVLIPPPVRGLR